MLELLTYRKALPRHQWPKRPPQLSPAQLEAREKYMALWHQNLKTNYQVIERFNHGYVTRLPLEKGWKTLEIGAGIGTHLQYEDLDAQEYCVLEYREEFCRELRKHLPEGQVFCGDIHHRQNWADATFDRIVAIHVLEHLIHLPEAIKEIARLLKPTGVLDIVIPCEGGLAHTFARKISAERLFKTTFKMDFLPIHLNEHVNSYAEVMEVLGEKFEIKRSSHFPLRLPLPNLNLVAGFRLAKRK